MVKMRRNITDQNKFRASSVEIKHDIDNYKTIAMQFRCLTEFVLILGAK